MKRYFILIVFTFLIVVCNSQTRVACIGNSITFGHGLKESEKYPTKLQKLLGEEYLVRNFGISGRTLLKKGDRPYWREKAYQEALSWHPEVVIIKLGTNDTKPQNWKYAKEFNSDYKALIKSFQKLKSHPKLYLCYPIPVFEDKWGINDSIVFNSIIPVIKKLGKKRRYHLIDLYHPLLGKSYLVFDGIHPNNQGTDLIAEIIFNSISEE